MCKIQKENNVLNCITIKEEQPQNTKYTTTWKRFWKAIYAPNERAVNGNDNQAHH